jgi:hypothetical protein
LLGWAMIIASKVAQKHIVFPLSIHAWVGTVTIFYCVAQVAMGFRKLEALISYPEKKILRYGGTRVDMQSLLTLHWRLHSYHGDAGLLLFDLGCLAVLLGLLSFLYFSFVHLLVELSVVVLWMCVHRQIGANSHPAPARDVRDLADLAHEGHGALLLDTRDDGVGESKGFQSPKMSTL